MSAISRIMSSTANSDLVLRPSARARVMRLSVDPRTGGVVLTYPRRVSARRAMAWADSQRGWIDAAVARVPPAIALTPGTDIPLRGTPHIIDWSEGRSRKIAATDGRIAVSGPRDNLEARLLRWLKREALAVLTEETHDYARAAGVAVSRVGVGDSVSRWGSCSSSGAIRYSWRLILMPDRVRRATVAHEVAHRIHMHHGPDFHALVADLFEGDSREARAWLKAHGAGLHRIGRAANASIPAQP
ncbi:hypothetical protein SAMN06295910_1110 [Allosphingosinicella indica]|uniref:YgjP-like metallopeptidase domain-containing protein n=2 Tax=Allosphingosinicella indica TaxID=941907 RepID=A0A1X7G592_9SPHN|nr:hypothetical protein SAMN06295910_1110 [Allosphingosinicella indica]